MTTQITAATLIFLIFVTVSSSQPTPVLPGLDVTEVLANADDLKVAANIITTLQIDAELKRQPVFTMFLPVDTAFKELPDTVMSKLHSSMDDIFILMKAHIVRKYFAPEMLHFVNTLKPPTFASEILGTSMYHLNISVIFPSTVTISTGVVEATVERTVYSKHPIAIYAVSKVLLPIEMFGGLSLSPPAGSPPPPPPPPPPPHSGQPPLISPQTSLAAALIFFLYFFVICI